MQKNGQSSVEIIIVLAVLLLFFSGILYYTMQNVWVNQAASNSVLLRSSAAVLVDAITSVSHLGNTSSMVVSIYLPNSVTNSSIENQTIYFYENTNVFSSYVGISMTGSLPQYGGTFDVALTTNGSSVALSYN
jgi:hypothetical protein